MTCTIVTCFYKTNTKKHTIEEYEKWMSNMLCSIETPMAIFCEEEFKEKLETLRGNKSTQIYIVPFWKLRMMQKKYKDYWERDFQRDTENRYHSYELYVLWNEKTNFVNAVVNMNPFNTEFYCWCDIGLFREKETTSLYKNWPKIQSTIIHDKIYLLNVFPFKEGELNILSNGLTKRFDRIDRVGGGVILGHKNVWERWTEVFYSVLDKYLQNSYFSGKDQSIMITICALYPELVKLIQPTNEYYRLKGRDGAWFYLRDFFI